jgi:hypothetical protein
MSATMNTLRLTRYIPALRRLGPYLLIELLLPGGTLLAIVLWLSQSLGRGALSGLHRAQTVPPAIGHVVDLRALACNRYVDLECRCA